MKTLTSNGFRQKVNFRFLLKLLLFIILLFFLDIFTGSLLTHFYFKQNSGPLFRTTYAIEKTSEEVLIFGTSKANHSYNPEIFKQKLGLSVYNVGRDGGSIFFDYALLNAILKRYTPKIIILDVSWEFETKQDAYDRLSMLLPYFNSHPEMRSVVEYKSPYEKFKLISKVYPYNSLLFSILAGNLESNKQRSLDLKGFVPLSKKWNEKIKVYDIPDYKFDSLRIKTFEAFIKNCIDAKVNLYIIVSPDFMKLTKVEKSNALARNLAEKYNIKFTDFSRNEMFLSHAEYFADPTHLNEDGAKLFSNMVADEIYNDVNRSNTIAAAFSGKK